MIQKRLLLSVIGIAAVASSLGPDLAAAQTRAEVIAKEQADKASTARPYEPNRAEEIFQRLEDGGFFLFGTGRGFYPAFGSVYPGGGFALGAGYGRFIGDYSTVSVRGLYSIANYKRIEATVNSPGHAAGRVDVKATAGWLDATRVPYFGLGQATPRGDRTSFRLTETYAEGGLLYRPTRSVHLRGAAGYETYDEKSGGGASPSIEERFTPETAPHLGEDPAFLQGTASAALLWLASPGYSRSGGLVRFSFQGFNPVSGAKRSFGLTRTEIVQHVPILRETWVISLRARTDSITGRVEDAPYFLLPSLGGGSTLRGYVTTRFRDRHTLLFSGEWRWFPNRLGLDMALFADAGSVASRRPDLSITHMKTEVGLGIRFHAPTVTALRIELARGQEGWRLIFAGSAPF